MTITRKIAAAFVMVMLLAAAMLAFAFYNAQKINDSNAWVVRTHKAQLSAMRVLSLLKDAETGQRGYLLTGDTRLLEPYRAALSEIDQALKNLHQLTDENDLQKKNATAFEVSAQNKLNEMAYILRLKKEQGYEIALGQLKTDRGRRFMDDARRYASALDVEEKRLLKIRQKEAADQAELAKTIIAFSGVAITLCFTVIGFSLNTSIVRSLTRESRERRAGIKTLTATIKKLAEVSGELLAIVTESASGAQEQAAALTETVSTASELNSTSTQAAQYADVVATVAGRADMIGRQGLRAVEETVDNMLLVLERTKEASHNIQNLAAQAKSIDEIIVLVGDIVGRTNMLALNAAIEAARAGENGLGFKLVASDVRALADQSKEAIAKITLIIHQLRTANAAVAHSNRLSLRNVDTAIDIARRAGDSIETLAQSLGDITEDASRVAETAAQQSTGIEQIEIAINNIHTVTQENLLASRRCEMTARDLKIISQNLQETLAALEAQDERYQRDQAPRASILQPSGHIR